MFAVSWQPANTARGDQVGEEGADQTGDREGKARSEETGEKFQDTTGQGGGRIGGEGGQINLR